MTATKPYYEMWNDGSKEFKESIRRMIRLGYRFDIIHIEKEHQQNQYTGIRTNGNN